MQEENRKLQGREGQLAETLFVDSRSYKHGIHWKAGHTNSPCLPFKIRTCKFRGKLNRALESYRTDFFFFLSEPLIFNLSNGTFSFLLCLEVTCEILLTLQGKQKAPFEGGRDSAVLGEGELWGVSNTKRSSLLTFYPNSLIFTLKFIILYTLNFYKVFVLFYTRSHYVVLAGLELAEIHFILPLE